MSLPFRRAAAQLVSDKVGGPAFHLMIEHFQGSAAGIDLVVMARSGKPSRMRNSSSFQAPRRIFTLPARHGELSGPNRVRLSPLCGAGETVKPHQMKCLALAGLPWVLAEPDEEPVAG